MISVLQCLKRTLRGWSWRLEWRPQLWTGDQSSNIRSWKLELRRKMYRGVCSVFVCEQTVGKGIAKGKGWCLAGETDQQGHSCLLVAELKPQFAWVRMVPQVWGNADRCHDAIYDVFVNSRDVSLHCVWSTLDGSECWFHVLLKSILLSRACSWALAFLSMAEPPRTLYLFYVNVAWWCKIQLGWLCFIWRPNSLWFLQLT